MLRRIGEWLLKAAGLLLAFIAVVLALSADASTEDSFALAFVALLVTVGGPIALGMGCLHWADAVRRASGRPERPHQRILFAVCVGVSLVACGFGLHLLYRLSSGPTHVVVAILVAIMIVGHYYMRVHRPWFSRAAQSLERSGFVEDVLLFALKGVFYLIIEVVFAAISGRSAGSMSFGGGSSGGGGASGRW